MKLKSLGIAVACSENVPDSDNAASMTDYARQGGTTLYQPTPASPPPRHIRGTPLRGRAKLRASFAAQKSTIPDCLGP